MDSPPDRDQLPPDLHAEIEAGFNSASALTGRLVKVWLRWLTRIVIVFAVTLGVYYVLEDCSLRFRIPRSHQPLTSMQVTRYLAIHKKNGKIEYASDQPETVVCANSVFPHFGFSPCWYVRRQSKERVDM
jgi:hypothetical protein